MTTAALLTVLVARLLGPPGLADKLRASMFHSVAAHHRVQHDRPGGMSEEPRLFADVLMRYRYRRLLHQHHR